MANYGKVFTFLGALVFGFSFLVMNLGGYTPGNIMMIVGLVMVIFGLPRLVQGNNPLIMGKIIRPKSAARAAWMWSMIIFNLTPFYFPGSRILYYGPPFPLYIIISNYFARANSGYMWLPAVYIAFIVSWIIGIFISGKYPGFVRIFFNVIMGVLAMFWVNFGIQMTLWTFFNDKAGLFLFSQWDGVTDFVQLLQPLGLSTGVAVMGTILAVRMLNQIYLSFAALNIKSSSTQALLFIAIILCFICCALPLYIGITLCLESESYMYPFVNYIGVLYIAFILFKTITAILGSFREFSKQKVGEGSVNDQNFSLNTAFFLVIIFIAWAPIFLPIVDGGKNYKNHSAYNPDWNGLGYFKDLLQDPNNPNGGAYEVMCVQSSFNVLTRLDPSKQIILIIAGPNVQYNPASEVPFLLTAMTSNFSMLIAEDHGTAETLLFEMFVASMMKTPITFIPKGILRDNASYWKNPAFPVITQFGSHITTAGISKVCLSYGSAFLGGEFISGFGWDMIGTTSGLYSFVDRNNDGMFTQDIDKYSIDSGIGSAISEVDPQKATFSDLLSIGVPLGGYPQAVFTAKELAINAPTPDGQGTYSSRIFCATDASWMNKELMTVKDANGVLLFDNQQFALNVIKYLTCGRDPEDCIIVFDEAHIKPETGQTELQSATLFGVFQGYVNWLSTNPILSLFYPLFALYSLRKWIPAEENKKRVQIEELLESEKNIRNLKFRTSSFFSRKINWYRVNRRYKQALSLLYRRIERKVHRLLGDQPATIDNIMGIIQSNQNKPLTKENTIRLRTFFSNMIDLKANKLDVREEEQFQNLFLEMQWVGDFI